MAPPRIASTVKVVTGPPLPTNAQKLQAVRLRVAAKQAALAEAKAAAAAAVIAAAHEAKAAEAAAEAADVAAAAAAIADAVDSEMMVIPEQSEQSVPMIVRS